MDGFTAADLIGVIGSLMVCGAYFGVSTGRLSPQAPPYHLINLAGAGLLLGSLAARPNPGAIVVEALWAVIALWALIGLWRRR